MGGDNENIKKILPIDTNPQYQSYDYLAFINGIISSSFENAELWSITHTLDILFSENSLLVFNREASFIDKGPIIVNRKQLFYYDILYHPEMVIGLIKELIHEDWYIEGSFNEKAIPEKYAYGKKDSIHSFFLHGYDDLKQELYAVGHTKSGQFESYKIKYTTFLESLKLDKRNTNTLFLAKKNNNYICKFDLDRVYQSIKDYLSSQNSYLYSGDGASFGINAVLRYVDSLNEISKRRMKVDLRNSRLLSENKKVLYKALQMLPAFSRIDNKDSVEKIYSSYSLHHYIAIKYNISGDQSILLDAINSLLELVEAEKSVLKKIVTKK